MSLASLANLANERDKQARMFHDVGQLVDGYRFVVRGLVQRHRGLLDQLREATLYGAPNRGPASRQPHESHPPIQLDPVDALSTIYVGISGWYSRLYLNSRFPAGGDWQKWALRQLRDVAPKMAPSLADDLSDNIRSWWLLAARITGWLPEQLVRIR